jgi:hypothetical protein
MYDYINIGGSIFHSFVDFVGKTSSCSVLVSHVRHSRGHPSPKVSHLVSLHAPRTAKTRWALSEGHAKDVLTQ